MRTLITLTQSVLASCNFRQSDDVDELRRLGKKLAQCRVGAELTQEKAAELAGITLRFYQDIEAGKKAPSYLTLRRLAGACRITSWDQLIP